jgi:hypothetical protein
MECTRTACPPSLAPITLSNPPSALDQHPHRLPIKHSKSTKASTRSNVSDHTFLTFNGNSTSRKRILYPQMIRCFCVCCVSHSGHLYVTYCTYERRDMKRNTMIMEGKKQCIGLPLRVQIIRSQHFERPQIMIPSYTPAYSPQIHRSLPSVMLSI